MAIPIPPIEVNKETYPFLDLLIEEESIINITQTEDTNISSSYDAEGLYVSTSTLETLNIAIKAIAIPLISLFGIVGNILCLIVMSNVRMKKNGPNACLVALSFSDLLFLLHTFIFAGIEILTFIDKDEGIYIRNIIFPYLAAYGGIVTARITSLITLLLGVERFIAVCFPIRCHRLCNKLRSVTTIVIIYILTFVLFIPYPLKYYIAYGSTNASGIAKSKAWLLLTDLGQNKSFFDVYGTILNISFRFLPVIILIVLNTIIIRVSRKTWRLRRRRNNITKKSSMSGDQVHFTVMLITVCTVFLVCIIPGAVHSIISHTWTEYSRRGKTKNLFLSIHIVTYLLEIINSSVNFVIYMVMCSKFNRTVRAMVSCKNSAPTSDSSGNSQSKDASPLVGDDRIVRTFSNGSTKVSILERRRNKRGTSVGSNRQEIL